MDYWDRQRKHRAVEQAEADGRVADDLQTRQRLLEQVKAGKITLQQAQSQLKKIKRDASKIGKTTRAKAWSLG